MGAEDLLVHATTIDLCGWGVIITGVTGSGKSDLALRLIQGGAFLVADDQTNIEISDHNLMAEAPRNIAGLLEVRGVGVVRVAWKRRTILRLAVTLGGQEIERMPEPQFWTLPKLPEPRIPALALRAFEVSTPDKVLSWLAAVPNA